MKVKQLIKELKKLPQNLEVGFANHDNYDYEIAGWSSCVVMIEKKDYENENFPCPSDKDIFDGMPNKYVSIRA